ncbi:MAG: hypothetical protein LBF61_10885 [Azoarcus sp.]|nr:hypothetical protein [Azoarcus sp.]
MKHGLAGARRCGAHQFSGKKARLGGRATKNRPLAGAVMVRRLPWFGTDAYPAKS